MSKETVVIEPGTTTFDLDAPMENRPRGVSAKKAFVFKERAPEPVPSWPVAPGQRRAPKAIPSAGLLNKILAQASPLLTPQEVVALRLFDSESQRLTALISSHSHRRAYDDFARQRISVETAASSGAVIPVARTFADIWHQYSGNQGAIKNSLAALHKANAPLMQTVLGRLCDLASTLVPVARADFKKLNADWGLDVGATVITALQEVPHYLSWSTSQWTKPSDLAWLRDLLK